VLDPSTHRFSAPHGRISALIGLLLVCGCRSYGERTQEAFGDFQSGQFEAASAAYASPDTTGSPFLAGAEGGMAALAAGDWEGALEALGEAARAVRDLEERALLSPESGAEAVASLVLNETTRVYTGEGFERVLVHSGLALAYLARGRLDDVYVEARRSNRLLESEEELYEASYAAGGLGHFLSAVAYELLEEPADAYIDYQRMAAKGVGDGLVGPALRRLASRLGRRDELDRLEERYGPAVDLPEGMASIVVIAGIGLGPFKEEVSAHIPTRNGLVNWAVPAFVERSQPVSDLRLVLPASDTAIATVVIEDVAAVAAANLEDRIAWLAARSAARGLAKQEFTRRLEDERGSLGRIAGELFSSLSERADLRSWKTLPDTWQACRAFVLPGVHELVLDASGGEARELGRFELEAGETMFVLSRTLGRRLYAHPIGGLRVTDVGGGTIESP